jgi:protein-S-isoprenylcysteine O-methyltransferase Ste14
MSDSLVLLGFHFQGPLFHLFVILYEEPTLKRNFSAAYANYGASRLT